MISKVKTLSIISLLVLQLPGLAVSAETKDPQTFLDYCKMVEAGDPEVTPELKESIAQLRKQVPDTTTCEDAYTALQALPDLRLAHSEGNGIADLRPLVGLKASDLLVSHPKLSDLSPLAHLPQLESLNIGYAAVDNEIADGSPLADIKNLRSLNFYAPLVEDVSFLTGLTQLNLLSITIASATDLDFVAGKTLSQFELNLKRPQQKLDLSPILKIQKLDFLMLGGEYFDNLSALAGLNSPTMEITSNTISDFSGLANMTVNELRLNSPSLTEVPKFLAPKDMQSLSIDMPNLTSLALLNNVQDFGNSLEENSNFLYIIAAGITDIAPIVHLNLRMLIISNAPNLVDLSPISRMKNLSDLGLWEMPQIEILPAFDDLPDFDSLNVRKTGFSDLGPFVAYYKRRVAIKKFNSISFDDNKISDLTPLADIADLKPFNVGEGYGFDGEPIDPDKCPIDAASPELNAFCTKYREDHPSQIDGK